jgi:putative ABC transport system permease protein
MFQDLPIAWLQLVRQKIRFLVTIAGMTFAVVLIFMQLGFQDALYDSATQFHRSLRGDLYLVSTQYKSLTSQQNFSRLRLYQALGVAGVASISPVYLQFAMLKNQLSGQKYALNVFGILPENSPFRLPEVNGQLAQLKYPDVAFFDRDSRSEFGPIARQVAEGKDVRIELTRYNELTTSNRVQVVGLFSLGPSFGVDGNLIINLSTFLDTFRERQATYIDIGVVTLTPGADPATVLAGLRSHLPVDVQVLTRDEFIALEKGYWANRTPIGFIFGLMVVVGFTVGVVVVYQILYSNISDHLDEFATLKAMGYTDVSLLTVVYQQAVIIAVLGYGLGFVLSAVLYRVSEASTHLPIAMKANQAAIVFGAALAICLLSSTIATNRLRSADPAEIFA